MFFFFLGEGRNEVSVGKNSQSREESRKRTPSSDLNPSTFCEMWDVVFSPQVIFFPTIIWGHFTSGTPQLLHRVLSGLLGYGVDRGNELAQCKAHL